MEIKRTVLIIPIDPRVLGSVTKKKIFQNRQKTEIHSFPLYFWVKSFENCLWDWGDQNRHESISKLAHNLLVNSTMGNYFAFFWNSKLFIFWTTLMRYVPTSQGVASQGDYVFSVGLVKTYMNKQVTYQIGFNWTK